MKKLFWRVMALGVAMSSLAQPVITQQPTNQVVLNGSNTVLTVQVSGTGPFTYQWQFNGTNLPNNFISTVAGKGVFAFSGDGGMATNAGLRPTGVTVDGLGNYFIADQNNGRIRKVDTNGIISTIVGGGASLGDGGPATSAALNSPFGVTFDSLGNLFIADTKNYRIRKVDTNGIITTVAGTNSAGFSGDGGPATNANLTYPDSVAIDFFGNLFIADQFNDRIRRVDTNGIISTVAGGGGSLGDGGAATNAAVNNPFGVFLDSLGDLFIADQNNKRIRKVDTNGIITTVAGNGNIGYSGDGGAATNAQLNLPAGVAVDFFGDLFIADTSNNRIRKVDTNGIISTVAGGGGSLGDGGTATNAALDSPTGVVLDGSGGLLIADKDHGRVRRITLGSSPVYPLAGATTNNSGNYQVIITSPSGSVTSSVVSVAVVFIKITSQPQSLIVTNGNPAQFAVAATGTTKLHYQWYFNTNSVIAGATNAVFNITNISANQAGTYNCVITNTFSSVTSSIVTLTVLVPPVITSQPHSVTVTNGGLASFSVGIFGTAPLGYQWYLNTNTAIAGGTSAVLSVSSSQTGSYFCVITNAYGSITSRVVSLTIGQPPVITLQPVAQTNVNGTMVLFNTSVSGTGPFTYQWQLNGTNLPNNIITTVAGNGTNGFSGDGGLAISAGLNAPNSAVMDASGNLFVVTASRVRKVGTNGIISTIAGGGSTYPNDGGSATNTRIWNAVGITIDGEGSIFVADYPYFMGVSFFTRIRKIDTNGIITTVAGGGNQFPNNIMATNASMDASDVAMDNAGNLFIAGYVSHVSSYGGNVVYKVDASGMMTIVAGKLSGIFGGYSGDGGAATNATLNTPQAVAVDASGNLFIADTLNYRIRKVDTNGIISTVAGGGLAGNFGDGGMATNASLTVDIGGVAVDAHGDLFFSNWKWIRQVDTNGIITTVAGNGISGYSGDGGAATNASLKIPQRVSVDAAGNLFIGDYGNSRIRKIALAGSPTLVLNNVTVNNAGIYSVTITSPYGSATSSNAVLTVIVPPSLSAALVVDGSYLLSWSTQSNLTYQLQYTTNLVAPVWQSLGSPITATNGTVSASDLPSVDGQRFYRVQLVQ